MAHVTQIPPPKATIERDLGAELRSYRVRKGLTLENLRSILMARGIRLSTGMLGKLERGDRYGSLPMRRRIFDFLLEGQG